VICNKLSNFKIPVIAGELHGGFSLLKKHIS